MIQYFIHEKIDKQKWDDCIEKSVNGLVYAYSWYLDNVASEQWDALVLNDYEAVFPLVWNKKFGIEYLYPPAFSQQLGLFSNGHISENLLDDFLNQIPEKFLYAEINLNFLNKTSHKDFKISQRITHHLELIEDYIFISKNYSDNTKRNIKKAEKNNLQIAKNIKPESLIDLFRKNQGGKISDIKEKNYFALARIMYQSVHKNSGEINGVFDEKNNLIAGGFFIKSNNKIINLFPSTNEKARENGAMFLLIDNLIKENAGKNLILDFEGSMIESIARFYKRFGAKEISYLQIKRNRLPWFIRWIK